MADKLISQSVVSFGHIAKPLRFLSVLLMWSKLLREVTDIDINVTAFTSFSSRMFLFLTVKQVQKLQAKRQHVHVCILYLTFTAVGKEIILSTKGPEWLKTAD